MTDDSVDEGQMEMLSDAVLKLLDVQVDGLALCHQLDRDMSLLPEMQHQYRTLLHDMSRKFGFSVNHLEKRLTCYTSAGDAVTLRPSPSG